MAQKRNLEKNKASKVMKAKSVFLSCITCCLFLQVNAQSSDTNTIVNEHSTWSVLGSIVAPNGKVWTQYIYFDGDSIIASNSYKKVFSCDDSLRKNVKYEGLIREKDKKTYFISANSETECLLYDFSLEKGMTFEYRDCLSQETQLLEVKNSDMVEINGVLKKRLQITYSPSSFYDYIIDTWIEEVGSLHGVLSPYRLNIDGVIYTLLCYYQKNELIYKSPEYSECYYNNIVSVQEVTNTSNVKIYPNPTSSQLTVTSYELYLQSYEIYDVFGKIVLQDKLQDNLTINVELLTNGIYVLKIYDINKQVSIFKIIKN